MRLLRHMMDFQRQLGIDRVKDWGYPRELLRTDAEDAEWYAYMEHREPIAAFVWYQGLPSPAPPGWMQFHVCGKPGLGFVLGDAHGMKELERTARSLGASRLYAVLPEELSERKVPVKARRRYLQIRGYKPDALGMFKELGG